MSCSSTARPTRAAVRVHSATLPAPHSQDSTPYSTMETAVLTSNLRGRCSSALHKCVRGCEKHISTRTLSSKGQEAAYLMKSSALLPMSAKLMTAIPATCRTSHSTHITQRHSDGPTQKLMRNNSFTVKLCVVVQLP